MSARDERRFGLLHVSPYLLVLQMRVGTRAADVVENALPADAEIVGCRFDALTGAIQLLVASMSYDVAPVGEDPPRLPDPVFCTKWPAECT